MRVTRSVRSDLNPKKLILMLPFLHRLLEFDSSVTFDLFIVLRASSSDHLDPDNHILQRGMHLVITNI